MRERVLRSGGRIANPLFRSALSDFGGSDGCGALASLSGALAPPQPFAPVLPQPLSSPQELLSASVFPFPQAPLLLLSAASAPHAPPESGLRHFQA